MNPKLNKPKKVRDSRNYPNMHLIMPMPLVCFRKRNFEMLQTNCNAVELNKFANAFSTSIEFIAIVNFKR